MRENITIQISSKGKAIALSMFFVCIILFPLVNKKIQFIQVQKNPTFTYSTKPEFSIENLDPFPHKYEKYYNENMECLPQAVAFNAYFKLNFLKNSPDQSKVFVGKSDWLFMAGDAINDYRGINLLSPEEINKIKKILHGRAVRLKKQSRIFYFALVPNKHRIYSEYLPDNIVKRNGLTIYDQVVEAIREDTLIHLIDLRGPLKEAKAKYLLYYKKDNHWNDVGAYFGYKAIIEHINKQFPNVSPVPLAGYDLDTTKELVGGEASLIGVDKFIKERRRLLVPKYNTLSWSAPKQNYHAPVNFPYPDDFEIVKVIAGSSLPTAVVIRDSFTDFNLQFFSENFKKTIFIFDNWEYKENANIVEKEKPDIVILETVERNIRKIIEFDHK